MASVLVEIYCPQHGLERFRIKIIRRLNIAANQIIPKARSRPKPGEINTLYVGRNISHEKVKEYLINYFEHKGIIKDILIMRMIT
jgi:hypothetical protein